MASAGGVVGVAGVGVGYLRLLSLSLGHNCDHCSQLSCTVTVRGVQPAPLHHPALVVSLNSEAHLL